MIYIYRRGGWIDIIDRCAKQMKTDIDSNQNVISCQMVCNCPGAHQQFQHPQALQQPLVHRKMIRKICVDKKTGVVFQISTN